jgi:hypothetical protein
MRMRWMAWVGGLCVAAGVITAHAADQSSVAWLHTSGNLNGDAPSTWGFNAVDGKPNTAWCAGQGKGAWLTVGFTRPVTITHVAVQVGALKGTGLDKGKGRVAELEMNDGNQKRTLTLRDDPGLQELQISPPITAQQVTFTVRDVFPGAEDAVCVGEVTLRNGTTEWLGDAVARQARSVSRPMLSLTGVWWDNPSAPEKFLTLALDGSFSWAVEPIMEGEPERISGTWEASGGKLTLKPKKGAPFTLRMGRERVAGKAGSFEQLALDGNGGPERLPGNYQPRTE